MRMRLQCGLIEAGLAACISSLCLSPSPGLPQDRRETATANGTNLSDTAAVQRIELQQRAILDAVERIRDDSHAALNRYTDAMLTQFNVLQESFAAQQVRDMEAVARLNRFTQNVVEIIIGATVLTVLTMAWIPLWATNRMAKKILDIGRARAAIPAGLAVPMPERLRIESAIERLEERLLTLEAHPAESAAIGMEECEVQPTQQTRSSKLEPTPRVALTVGEGSALVFLPHEVQSPPAGRLRRQFARLKKFIARGKAKAA